MQLPQSLDRRIHTVQREVEFARAMTPEERLQGVALACRAAIELLAYNAHAERILRSSDPLPHSSVSALNRLHERFLREQARPQERQDASTQE
jgi:hypothetical protein